ncbi:MAG: hypothetical protein KDD70_15635 [Bdellovibrionales bacterium]|nr:hypothetical protein [Bdellovibrionales bacterium]
MNVIKSATVPSSYTNRDKIKVKEKIRQRSLVKDLLWQAELLSSVQQGTDFLKNLSLPQLLPGGKGPLDRFRVQVFAFAASLVKFLLS